MPASVNLPISIGRGFASEDRVFWPNAKGLEVLKSETGGPLRFQSE